MTYQVRYVTKDMVYHHDCHSHDMAMAIGKEVCQMDEAIHVAVIGTKIEMLKKDGKIL